MRDINYVVELAKAYGSALITRDELQDEIHNCSLDTVMCGVNAFAEEFGDEVLPSWLRLRFPSSGNAPSHPPS